MPFPFAAAAAWVVGAVGTAAATAAGAAAAVGSAVTLGALAGTAATVVGGTLLVGGAVVTAAAISVYNDEKREEEARRARARASREQERILLEEKRKSDQKMKELKEEYGDNIPDEKMKPVMEDRIITLSKLEGNSLGLKDKGEVPDEEAASASDELDLYKKQGLAA